MEDFYVIVSIILLFVITFILTAILTVIACIYRRWNRLFLLWSTDLCRDTIER